jgi:hypothetical protein
MSECRSARNSASRPAVNGLSRLRDERQRTWGGCDPASAAGLAASIYFAVNEIGISIQTATFLSRLIAGENCMIEATDIAA